jgi:hypothetical protein
MAALRAVQPAAPVHGVTVSVIVAQGRVVQRKAHYRFEYRLDGKRCSKAAAAARLAEAP